MRNIKITIEYDGSRYQGWTRLGKDESNNTISAKIIDVLGKMTGEKNIELNCGCRTEVGVHAYAQVANFKTSSNLSTKDIQHYLNRYLPMDIAITEVEEVPDRFHAQLNAVSKTYVYRMTIMDVPSVFERKHTYHCFKTPDKKAMQQAALLFIGEHDFRNFSTAKKSKNTTREVYDIDIYGDNEEMQILIQADDFLHNMARLMKLTVDYARSKGYTGDFYIEPKPKEPTKHQYDFDTATVLGFLRKYGLDKDFKMNIEANHATLAQHTFQHELRVARDNGVFGSIDANQGDPLLGWDTDQFPTNAYDCLLYTSPSPRDS